MAEGEWLIVSLIGGQGKEIPLRPFIPIIVVAIIVMIGLFAAFSVRGAQRVKQLKAETLARAIPAEAIVKDVEQIGSTGGANPRLLVQMKLDVHASGGGTYQAT